MSLHRQAPADRLELPERLAGCESYEAFGADLLPDLTRHIGAESGVCLVVNMHGAAARFTHYCVAGTIHATAEAYVGGHYQGDPVFQHCVHLLRQPAHRPAAGASVFRLSDLARRSVLHRTNYYRDFLGPAGVRHVLGIAVTPAAGRFALFGFHRYGRARDFSPACVLRAQEVSPALAASVRHIALCRRLEILEELVCAGLAAGNEFLVVDRALDVLYATPCALERVGVDGHRFDERSGAAARQLVVACRELMTHPVAAQLRELLLSSDNESVAPIRATVSRARQRDWCIVNLDPPCSDELRPRDLQACTRRETQVVERLLAGDSNKQIAARLGISVHTVENHLRAVYRKADVRSRTALIARWRGV